MREEDMIIGLTGAQGVGKTTVAKVLEAEAGFVRIGFAAHLRAVCCLIFGCPPDHFEGTMKDAVCPAWSITHRHMMQQVGTDVARAVHPDVWVRAWEWTVAVHNDAVASYWGGQLPSNIVADDCRFDNEVEAVRRLGGKVVRIKRVGYTAVRDIHSSEGSLTPSPDAIWR